MKTIISGGRTFNDYEFLKKRLAEFNITLVLCGECSGTDQMGKRWAIENNIPVESFPAEWDEYGKAAGPMRNKEMADNADQLIAFWDGNSKGTRNMIGHMTRMNKEVHIVRIGNS